jgi:hypothetical protein
MSYPAYLSHASNYLISDAATVTASTTASGFPVANVVSLPIAKPHRFTGDASESYLIDLGSAKEVTLAAVVAHNLSDAAIVTLRGGSSADPDGSQFEEEIEWREREMFLLLDEAETYRYWKLGFEDADNENEFVQVGYVMLGAATRFAFGFKFDWALRDNYENARVESEWGVPHVTKLYNRVNIDIEFEPLLSSEAATLRALVRALDGDTTPFLFIPDADEYEGYFGRFASPVFEQRVGLRRQASLQFKQDSAGRILV